MVATVACAPGERFPTRTVLFRPRRSVVRRRIPSRSTTVGPLRAAWDAPGKHPQSKASRLRWPEPSALFDLFGLLDDFRLFHLLFHLLFRQRLRGGLDFFVLDLG